jgi:hypothetical protein
VRIFYGESIYKVSLSAEFLDIVIKTVTIAFMMINVATSLFR